MADPTREEVEDMIRQADAAGDAESVTRLLSYYDSAFGGGTDPSGGRARATARGAMTGVANFAGAIAGLPVSGLNLAAQTLGAPGVPSILQSPQGEDTPIGGVTDMQARFRGGINSMNFPRLLESMSGQTPTTPNLTYESLQDLPESERGWATAGEVGGASMVPGLGLVGLARLPSAAVRTGRVRGPFLPATGPRPPAPLSHSPQALPTIQAPLLTQAMIRGEGMLPRMGRDIVGRAANTPGRFLGIEGISAVGAAGGGAGAQAVAPDSAGARFVGETLGGIFGPGVLASRVIEPGIAAVQRTLAAAGNEGAAMDMAARTAQRSAERLGENPAEIAAGLRANAADAPATGLTSAQTLDSPVLQAIEARIAQQNPEFGAQAQRAGQGGLEQMRDEINRLIASGDPRQFQRAIVLRRQYFDRVIGRNLEEAETQARRVLDDLGPAPTQEARQAASVEASRIMDQAFRQARGAESRLWDEGLAAMPDMPMPATGLTDAYRSVRANMLPESSLPGPLDAAMRRILGDDGGGMARPREIKLIREEAMNAARQARADGDFSTAGRLDQIAQGALDDMMEMGGESLVAAREYSRALNDRFTRGFGARATGTDPRGGIQVNPETLLDTAYAGRNASVNARQLQEGAEFGGDAAARIEQGQVRTRGGEVPVDPTLGPQMAQAQEDFLRNAAAFTRNADGTVDPRKLQQFLARNEVALQQFPQLRQQLGDLETATTMLNDVTANMRTAQEAIEQTALNRAAGFENATAGVNSILTGRRPIRDYGQLARRASATGDDAVSGLRSATLDWARNGATDASGNFSFARYRERLTRPLAEGDPPLLEIMVRNGVMTRAEANRMNTLLRTADRIEASMSTGRGLRELVEEPSVLQRLVTRISGARAASTVGRMLPGAAGDSGLIIAAAGSSAMQDVTNKIPAGRQMLLLERAARDPEFMAVLMERVPAGDVVRERQLARQINGFLIQSGILNADDAINDEDN